MALPVALCLRNVTVRFGTKTVLENVSLHVHRGEILGLLGPNGSGKSTTLAIAAGILDPHEGSTSIEDIPRSDQPAMYAQKVGFVPQAVALYEELTVLQNLTFFGKLYGFRNPQLASIVHRGLMRARLHEQMHQGVNTLSGGMKQRLSIACALLHDPLVVLLDEPTAALDETCRDALLGELQRLRDEGHAVVMTTHHQDEAELGCDRIARLDRGQLVELGTAREVLKQPNRPQLMLYGQLLEKLPRFLERNLRNRLQGVVELEIIGRRLRLTANTSEDLGRAMAVVLAEGVQMESFRTAPGRMTPLPVEARQV